MSSKKIDRALYGPSIVEVVLGAVLSFVLGVLGAGVYLVLKPVETVKALPKEPMRGTIYYVEGSRDATKGKGWDRKHKLLVSGRSIALSEDELNAVFATPAAAAKPAAPAVPPKPGAPADKSKAAPPPPPPAAPGAPFVAGTPNFRLHDGQLQIGVPCTINAFTLTQSVTVLATGTFSKEGDAVVFEPKTYYVGSLAVDRLPAVAGFVTKKILASQTIPDDLDAAWKKLADVSIDAKQQLQLTMP